MDWAAFVICEDGEDVDGVDEVLDSEGGSDGVVFDNGEVVFAGSGDVVGVLGRTAVNGFCG